MDVFTYWKKTWRHHYRRCLTSSQPLVVVLIIVIVISKIIIIIGNAVGVSHLSCPLLMTVPRQMHSNE